MGGEQFDNEVITTETMIKAFKKCRKAAQYDYGHAGYTGTIAEKSEFETRGTFDTWERAREFAEKDSMENEKWGPAFVVEVTEEGKHGYIFYGWASS